MPPFLNISMLVAFFQAAGRKGCKHSVQSFARLSNINSPSSMIDRQSDDLHPYFTPIHTLSKISLLTVLLRKVLPRCLPLSVMTSIFLTFLSNNLCLNFLLFQYLTLVLEPYWAITATPSLTPYTHTKNK